MGKPWEKWEKPWRKPWEKLWKNKKNIEQPWIMGKS
jgi:hypothetical protein